MSSRILSFREKAGGPRMAPVLSALALLLAALPAAALDAGGVSLALDAVPAADGGRPAAGENLIQSGGFEEETIDFTGGRLNGWGGAQQVHVNIRSDAERLEVEAQREALKAAVKRFRTRDNPHSGDWCAALVSPPEIQEMRDADGKPPVSNRIQYVVDAPNSDASRKYRLSLFLRGRFAEAPGAKSFSVLIQFWGGDRKETRDTLHETFQTLPVQWERREVEFSAPPGTTRMRINLALYGLGEVYIDDVRLEEVPLAAGFTARLMPYALLDKTFHIGEGMPGGLTFALLNDAGAAPAKPRLMVRVPAGFEALASNDEDVPLVGRRPVPSGGTLCELDLERKRTAIVRQTGLAVGVMWNVAVLVVRPVLEASETRHPLTYWVEDGDYRSPAESVDLVVIPPFAGDRPKIFRSAGILGRDFAFTGDGDAAAMTAFYVNAGFNSIHGHFPPAMRRALKTAGVERYAHPYFLRDGYRIGQAPKPPEARFRLVDGAAWIQLHEMICPTEVYREGAYYRDHVVPMIAKLLVDEDFDHIMPNWEPYIADFKGCFCDRCREEFVRYADGRVAAADIRAAWPANVIANFRDEWVRFRAWQHGRLAAQIEKTINELGRRAGKTSHFIPSITSELLNPRVNAARAQYAASEFLDDLPWIEPWGPYIYHRLSQPHEYLPGLHLLVWHQAEDVKRHVAAAAKRPPKLIAFPHSYQSSDWVTEPEALAFNFLCFFLNGWEGAFAYYFPRGYDHRHWREIARANTLIARHEDFVSAARDVTADVSIAPATPLPKPIPASWAGGRFLQRLPQLADAAMLQAKGFVTSVSVS